MNYTIADNDIFSTKPSLLERILLKISKKQTPLEYQIDGLKSDYAMALDQCQLMKQHIQELESKIDHLNATMDLRPEAVEPEVPYSTAIVLAKRGCDKEEIREACGLTDSEADLILTLHNKTARQADSTVLAN